MPDHEHDSAPDGWLIYKAGRGWYRPQAQGYTNDPRQAGRYTREEADAYSHPNGWDGPRDEISIHHESEVVGQSPEPSSSEVRVPDYWAVHSVSGAHVGLWVDEMDARGALAHYPNGKLTPLYATLSPTVSQPGTGEDVEWLDKHIAELRKSPNRFAEDIFELEQVRRRLSDYQALKAANEALMVERTSLIETKREQIDRLTQERDNLASIVASGIDDVAGASLDDLEARATAAEARLSAVEGKAREALDEALRYITDIDNTHKSVRLIREALTTITGGENAK